MPTFKTKPDQNGIYRVKVVDQDLYWEFQPANYSKAFSPYVISRLADGFVQWKFISCGTDTWKISSFYDGKGLTIYKSAETYWGYGYAVGADQTSDTWQVKEKTVDFKTFSKINMTGNANVLDSDPAADGCVSYGDIFPYLALPDDAYVRFDRFISITITASVKDSAGSSNSWNPADCSIRREAVLGHCKRQTLEDKLFPEIKEHHQSLFELNECEIVLPR
ncbi:hypothetical protein A0H81_06691 [Grifola frondosa]|uniref:Uncharacterized protein n=1 Tax=Grifola frondosa TaxID=5627 RepID=A0A1C7M894_GRIFR|nr:hypothetical protein A0H81_06691 [Grifola frondosa]